MTRLSSKLYPYIYLLALIVLVNLPAVSFSQFSRPVVEWDKDLGGPIWEALNSVQQTYDQGYILAGYSSSDNTGDVSEVSRGSVDFWIVKTDDQGNKEWDRRYGGLGTDQPWSVHQTRDSGYIVGGFSESNATPANKSENSRGGQDFWLIKLDQMGNRVWDRTYGGSGDDLMFDAIQTSDGGYLMGGNSASGLNDGEHGTANRGNIDWWVVKVDAMGNIEWERSYGGSEEDRLNSIVEDTNGNFVLAGATASDRDMMMGGEITTDFLGVKDAWLLKVSSIDGSILDEDRFGGTDEDEINSLIQTEDGGFLLGCGSRSDIAPTKSENNIGIVDMWIVKIDYAGNVEWDRTFAGADSGMPGSNLQNCYSVKQNSIGHYLVAGFSNGLAGNTKEAANLGAFDFWLLYLDPNGTKLWDMTFGGDQNDVMENVFQTDDGGYILAGHSSTDVNGDKTDPTKGLNDYWIVKTRCDLELDLPDVTVCQNTDFVIDAYDPQCIDCRWIWSDGNTTDSIRTFNLAMDQTISVTLTDGVGCARFEDIEVTVRQSPTIDLGIDQEICRGGDTQLDAGLAESYNWSTGDTIRTITVDTIGTFSVTITDANGCTNTNDIDISYSTPFVVDLGPDTTICENGTIELDAGNPGFSYDWTPSGNNQTRVFDQAGTYQVTVTDNNNCQVSDTINIAVYQRPTVIDTTFECDVNNGLYTVTLTLSSGDPQSYTVNGSTAGINGQTFTSLPITSGDNYRFEVSDGRGCDPIIIEDTYTCPCISEAGSLVAPLEIDCGVTQIRLEIDQAPLADANDLVQFVLHDGDANTVGTILSIGRQPFFRLEVGMSFDVTYYVVIIVGNDDGSGNINPMDQCRTVSLGVPITFREPPVSTIVNIGPLQLSCQSSSSVLDGSASSANGSIAFAWESTDGGSFEGATNQVQATATAEGTYFLIVTDENNACADTAQVSITSSDDRPTIVIDPPSLLTCLDTLSVIDASQSADGVQYSYQWSGPSIVEGDTTLRATVDQPGSYELIVTDNTNGCTNTQSVNVPADYDIPDISVEMGGQLDCLNPEIEISGQFNSTVPTDFGWQTMFGNFVANQNTLRPTVNQPGRYYFLATNLLNGCTAIDSVEVSIAADVPSGADLVVEQPGCNEDSQGSILVSAVNGGAPPLLYAIDDTPFGTVGLFRSLDTGPHVLKVQDSNGCEWDTTVVINAPQNFVVSIGGEKLIPLGDSTLLMPQTNLDVDTFYWTSAPGLADNSLWNPVVRPEFTTTYELTVISTHGCQETAFITINVEKQRNVYIPNAFSPNNDGFNDRFVVSGGQGIEIIKSINIYNRWGALMYSQQGLTLDDFDRSWDGTFKDEKMNSGAYVYHVVVLFTDGYEASFGGDVTLVK